MHPSLRRGRIRGVCTTTQGLKDCRGARANISSQVESTLIPWAEGCSLALNGEFDALDGVGLPSHPSYHTNSCPAEVLSGLPFSVSQLLLSFRAAASGDQAYGSLLPIVDEFGKCM